MEKISDELRNLFNPYRNISCIFKKKLEDKDNVCISFESDVRFDVDDFSQDNFKQSMQIDIAGLVNDPMLHRNEIHPIANKVMHECKLNLVLYSGQSELTRDAQQTIAFSKKGSGYSAFLMAKVNDPAYLNTLLSSFNQSTEVSIKIDLLCDDSTFANLDVEKRIEVIVHGLSISFNLGSVDSIIDSIK